MSAHPAGHRVPDGRSEAPLRTPIQTSRLPLPDGGATTLVTARLPGAPASVYLRFDAGAADERPGEHGAAHVLEHMLFKGTPTRGIGEAARAIEALGGDLNAWTSHDELVLHAEVAGSAWLEVVEVVADMVLHATLDPEELARELPVVLEEIASYEDDPDEQLSDAVQAALWPGHAYGRPVTARADEVRTLGVDVLAAFRRRELNAGRATWVVVADAEHAAVAAVVTDLLAPLGSGTPRAVPGPGAPQPGIVRPAGTFDDRVLELCWRAPPADHPDHAPLHVLSALLSPSSGDRITECLDADPKVGFAGWSEVFAGRFGASVSVGFRPLPGRSAACLGRVRELLARLGRHAGGRLVGRARDTLLADLDFAEQTTASIAEDLLFHASVHGDPTHRERWRDALAAVTPDDVARVARIWLRPGDAVLGVLDVDTPDEALLAAWSAPSAPLPARADERLHGCRVLLVPTDAPVAAVRVLVPGGALRVPPRLAGLGTAWSRTVHRGAGRYDGEALHDALDDLAADFHASEGAASLSLSVTAPAHHLIDVIRLLGEVVLEPHLDDQEWSLVRDELVEDARTRLDRPRQVLSEAMQELRFRGHPWSMRAGGTTVTLGRIGQADLRRFHQQHFVAGALTVAVVGGMDPDEVRDALGWLEELPQGTRRASTQPWPALTPGIHTVHAGTRQATIAIQGGGVSFRETQRRGLELAAAVLDGQGGRLFLDLRERRGLAYELWAQDAERAEGGWFEVGLVTDPARIDEASSALHEALRALVTDPPSEAELTRARAVVWGRRVLASQRVEDHASRLAYRSMWGRSLDPEERRIALDAVTPAEVAREVEAMLSGGLLEVRCLPRTDRT